MNKLIKLLLFLAFLQVLGNSVKAEAKKGKGKAFGAGILAGGLAGAAVGHILTRPNTPTEVHHHHHIVDPNAAAIAANTNPSPPPPRPSVIIERGETLANGCYKEIVKEPDVHDVTKFIETEKLVCPHNVPVPVVHPVPVVPIQHPVVPALHIVPVPVHHPPATDVNPNNQTHDNPTHPQPVYTASLTPIQPNHHQVPDPATNGHHPVPLVPVVPHHQPNVVQHVQPSHPTGPSQVIVLSKKTGSYEDDKHKKNSGNKIMVINFGFMLIIVGLMGLF